MAASPARKRARQAWLVLHRWLGLALGGVFVLLGLTGSLLVFYTELDAALNPVVAWQEADGTVQAYEPVLQALQRAHPQRDRGWRIELPPEGRGMVTARYLKPAETAGAFFAPLLVTVHPTTHELRASRFWGEFGMTWLYDLHMSLLAGETGHTVVGLLGLAMVMSLLSGLWLWWPSSSQRAAAWRLKRGASLPRLCFDLHRVAGIYPLVVALMLAMTGAMLALPQWFEPLIARWSPPRVVTPPSPAPAATGGAWIGVDDALACAQARFPQGTLRWVDTPTADQPVYRVRLQQPGEPSRRFPRTLVWIDASRGEVLAVRDARGQGAGDTLLAWLHPLHNGEAFGLAGRVIVCVAGLVPLLLMVTGLMRWRDRRRGARARRSISARGPSVPA